MTNRCGAGWCNWRRSDRGSAIGDCTPAAAGRSAGEPQTAAPGGAGHHGIDFAGVHEYRELQLNCEHLQARLVRLKCLIDGCGRLAAVNNLRIP